MSGVGKLASALALLVLLTLGLGACGGGDSTESTATATPRVREAGRAAADSGRDSSSSPDDGSASFRTPGGDNSIQNFGAEAGTAELRAAEAVLAAYLRARAQDEWALECSYLAQAAIAPLEQLASRSSKLRGRGCGAILATLAGRAPRSTRANTLAGAVASLRVAGKRGFALYHGAGGVDYFVPMLREGGEWKVGALAPIEFT